MSPRFTTAVENDNVFACCECHRQAKNPPARSKTAIKMIGLFKTRIMVLRIRIRLHPIRRGSQSLPQLDVL
jgi:hypothetical protein